MGSIKYNKSRKWRRPFGKILAPFNTKLENVRWGKYKLEQIFSVKTSKSIDEGKLKLSNNYHAGLYEFIGRTRVKNGVKGYVNKMNVEPNKGNVISVSQIGTITAQYRKYNWYASQNIFVLEPKINLNEKNAKFIVSSINKALSQYSNGYSYYPTLDSLKQLEIQLPLENDNINYEFMEFIINELEESKINILIDYLEATGLDTFDLTIEEAAILESLNSMEFKEFDIVDVFDIKNTKNILSRDIVENSGDIPYLCASSENNSVSTYINYKNSLIDKGNCIFIGGKTFVVSYQEKDFFSNDSHNLALYMKYHSINKYNQLFLATCVNKSLSHKYFWGDSVSSAKIKKDKILLPTKDSKINYGIMNSFIKIIYKTALKNILSYIENKKYEGSFKM